MQRGLPALVGKGWWKRTLFPLTGGGQRSCLPADTSRWSVQFLGSTPNLRVASWPISTGFAGDGWNVDTNVGSLLFKWPDYLSMVTAEWFVADNAAGAILTIIETFWKG